MYFSKKKIGFFISGENGVISLGKHDEKLEKKKKSSQNVVIRVTDKVTKLYADSTIKKDKERRGLTLRLFYLIGKTRFSAFLLIYTSILTACAIPGMLSCC